MSRRDILACRGSEQTKEPKEWPIGVRVTHYEPNAELRLELLLQGNLAQLGPIIRGDTIPSGPYAGRGLDYSRDASGRLVPGALSREAIWSLEQHVSVFETASPGQRVQLLVGNG